jgi:hypothetical protein
MNVLLSPGQSRYGQEPSNIRVWSVVCKWYCDGGGQENDVVMVHGLCLAVRGDMSVSVQSNRCRRFDEGRA